PKRKALIYSRALHLALLGKGRPTPSPDPVTDPVGGDDATDPTPPPGPEPPVLSDNPYIPADLSRHVLRRLGYGVSPAGLADGAREAIVARLPDQAEPIWEVREAIRTGEREGWRQLTSVHTGHIMRAAWSRRQLLTVMEEFWANHFNVTVPSDNIDESRAHYQ